MITVYEEDAMLSKFESMSEIEIKSFLEKLYDALSKRSLSHLINGDVVKDEIEELKDEIEELNDKIRKAKDILS